MSYLNKELDKVPGPTNYFKQGHPLTTFTFENEKMSQCVLQGKNAPQFSYVKVIILTVCIEQYRKVG